MPLHFTRAVVFKTQGLSKSVLSFDAGVMQNLGVSKEMTDWVTFQEIRGWLNVSLFHSTWQ